MPHIIIEHSANVADLTDMDALVDALGAVRGLEDLTPSLPEAVERTIAKAVSEAESGEGEAETLRRITVNTGRIEGGTGVNTRRVRPSSRPLRMYSSSIQWQMHPRRMEKLFKYSVLCVTCASPSAREN